MFDYLLIIKLTFTSYICLLFSHMSCAMEDNALSQNFTFRIVGGVPADIIDYPYQVAVLKGEKHHCGGSIINELYILTAAHCTLNAPFNMFTVRVGSSYWNKGGQLLNVVAKFEHPSYITKIFHNDISILKLGQALILSKSVQPVQLPKEIDVLPPPGTMATVTGWGRLDYELEGMSDKLMVTHVPLISRDTCETNYANSVISRSMICAGYSDGGRDACIGDSGGPLTVDGRQIGIVSWGVSCAGANSPGVYSNVIVLRDFISQIVGN